MAKSALGFESARLCRCFIARDDVMARRRLDLRLSAAACCAMRDAEARFMSAARAHADDARCAAASALRCCDYGCALHAATPRYVARRDGAARELRGAPRYAERMPAFIILMRRLRA